METNELMLPLDAGAGSEQLRGAVEKLSDGELEARLKSLAGIERKALAFLLVHLAEFDSRRLHADRGHPSLFSYCMGTLGYSEQAAYKRIRAARAARAHPELLKRLESGELNLTSIVILSPYFREGNIGSLVAAAAGKRTLALEAFALTLASRPDQAARRRELITALAPGLWMFRFTGGERLLKTFERARDLTSAGRSIEAVVAAALEAFLEKADPLRRNARREARKARSRREQRADGPRPRPRRAAASLRDRVWERDGGQCMFLAEDGGRCPSTTDLQLDHIQPYALGGSSDDIDNLRLLCGTHNRLLGRRAFGPAVLKDSSPGDSEIG